jgi:hypothetical protein
MEQEKEKEEQVIEVSYTKAKSLREKKPRTEAQLAATARLVEATKARREAGKAAKEQEQEALREAEAKRLEEQQRKAVEAAKVVVKPKRRYVRKEKPQPQPEPEPQSESESEEEEEPPRRVQKARQMDEIRKTLSKVDETLARVKPTNKNHYELLLQRKGFM